MIVKIFLWYIVINYSPNTEISDATCLVFWGNLCTFISVQPISICIIRRRFVAILLVRLHICYETIMLSFFICTLLLDFSKYLLKFTIRFGSTRFPLLYSLCYQEAEIRAITIICYLNYLHTPSRIDLVSCIKIDILTVLLEFHDRWKVLKYSLETNFHSLNYQKMK